MVWLALAFATDLPSFEAQLTALEHAEAEWLAPPEALQRVGADADGRFQAAHRFTTDVSGVTLGAALTCQVATWEPVAVDCDLPFTGDWPDGQARLGERTYPVPGQKVVFQMLRGEASGSLTAAPPTAEDRAQEAQARREEVEKELASSKLLMKLIGTTGEGGGNVENVWSDEDMGFGDLDAAFAESAGIGVDVLPAPGGGEAADIADIGAGGGGAGSPTPRIEGRIESSGAGQPDAAAADIEKVMHRYSGQLTYCYELRLKSQPDLAGSYEATLAMEAGRVVGTPEVKGDDPELRDCIAKKLRRWRFPAEATGATWSWTFSVAD